MQPLQPVYRHRVWNCGSKYSHGEMPIAFPHQMAQLCHSLPHYSPCPMHLPPVWYESAPFYLPGKKLLQRVVCGRSVWRVILLWGRCIVPERTFPWRFPAKIFFRFSQYSNYFFAEFSFLRFELIKMLPEIPVTVSVFAAGAFPLPLPRLSNSIIFFL